jgi:hypothetical protein
MDELHRKAGLAALLAAQSERTFPLTVHQFIVLGGVWMDAGFKRMLGIRATKLHKALFGSAPERVRARGCGRNMVAIYPRGILEQALAEIVVELGQDIEDYKAQPYRKVPPSPELIEKREAAEAWRRIAAREDGRKVYVASEAEINRWVKEW